MATKNLKLARCIKCGTQTLQFDYNGKFWLYCPNDACGQRGIGLDTENLSENQVLAAVRRWNERHQPDIQAPLIT